MEIMTNGFIRNPINPGKLFDSGNVDHFSCNTRLKVIVHFMERWLETVDQNSGRLGQVIT
jgi:hypothetical protein